MSDDSPTAPAPPPPRPVVPLMTLDEARGRIAEMAASVIGQAKTALEAKMEADPDKASNEYQNGLLVVQAAEEFILGAMSAARAATRPRILRPERSVKIHRPH